jgi:acyl carrier protein
VNTDTHTSELTTRIGKILIQFADSSDLTPENLDPSVPVFGPSGIISDSLDVLDALCQIEDDLGINIPDEDLTEELFASLESLTTYVEARVRAAEGA